MLYSNIKKYYKKEEIKIQRELQTWRHSFSTCSLCAHHLPFLVPIIIMYIHHHLIINTRHPTKESMTRAWAFTIIPHTSTLPKQTEMKCKHQLNKQSVTHKNHTRYIHTYIRTYMEKFEDHTKITYYAKHTYIFIWNKTKFHLHFITISINTSNFIQTKSS